MLELDIQRFADAGKIVISTELDTKNFERGINAIQSKAKSGGASIKSIVAGLGITKLIGAAFSTITSNIDGAVKRLDTLNNFSKVMGNLGVSAKDADKSIAKMSDKLMGLPTTLDAGAMAVQRFTSKNGDVAKSTDLFLALNNAILAGGAPAEIQASALEQLSQAYAKGKPDMMEWRTAMSAMPAQLKQVAIAMGYIDADALGEALRKGDVSMNDFMDTIVKLNKTGVKGFKNFEQQARASTGGLQTTIANAKNAVLRGVASLISGFDKALKKAKLGSLGDNIAKIGKMAEKVLSGISDKLSRLNLSKTISLMKTLASVVGVVVTTMIAYNTVLKVTQAIQFAKDITAAVAVFLKLVPAIQSATVSQTALNMAMSINPIGAVVAGVVALTGGLLLLSKAIKDETTETDRINKSLSDYKNSMKEAQKAKKEYIETNLTEISHSQRLANELKNIVDVNGNVKKGYEERAKFIVGELNSALGTEISMTGNSINNYSEIEKKIYDVIKAKRAKIVMEAQEKVYKEALEQEKKLEDELAKSVINVNNQVKEKKKWLSETSKEYGISESRLKELLNTQNVFAEGLEVGGNELVKLKGKYSELNNSITESKETLQSAQSTYANNQKIIGDYENALQNLADKNYAAVLKIYQDTSNLQGKTREETVKNYSAYIEAQKMYLEDLKNNKYKYDEEYLKQETARVQGVIDNLEKEKLKYTDTTDKVIGEEKRKQEGINAETDKGHKKNKELWNKSLSEQLSTITGKKIEFKKTGKDQVQAYIDGHKEGKPMTTKEARELANDMNKEIKKGKPGATEAGRDLVRGTANGINDRNARNSAFGAISSFGSSLLQKLKSSLKEHSPSKATREMGINFDKGFALGVKDEKNNSLKVISDYGNDMLNELDSVYSDMQRAIDIETDKMSANVQTSGTYQVAMKGNPTFNLKDNSTNQTQLVVNGRVLAEVVNTENRNREVAKA